MELPMPFEGTQGRTKKFEQHWAVCVKSRALTGMTGMTGQALAPQERTVLYGQEDDRLPRQKKKRTNHLPSWGRDSFNRQ